MTELFTVSLRLDGEAMMVFGRSVARVCVKYPTVMLSDAQAPEAHLTADENAREAALTILARIIENTNSVVTTGDALAALIGMCQPVRIDGGPLQ